MKNAFTKAAAAYKRNWAVGLLLPLLLSLPSAGGATNLLHNSQTTGSAKWGGKWGTAEVGSKYGEFTCGTCHVRNATNIKRVGSSITTPDGSNWEGPAAPTVTVSFTDAREGSADFGDDAGGHNTSSKVCEVCHSATSYHRYNTAGQPGGTFHYNRSNCVSCHKHSQAFKATCYSCHGDEAAGNFWPDSAPLDSYADRNGAHAKHIDSIYNANSASLPGSTTVAKKNATCSWCHPNPGAARGGTTGESDHMTDAVPGNTADVHGDGRTGAPVTYFKNSTGGNDSNGAFDPVTHVCFNIDCHANGTTPAWYGDTIAPAPVTLAAAVGSAKGAVTLSWTAPGDDHNSGTAYQYEVRYRTGGAVTEANWSSSTLASGVPVPAAAGATQSMTVYGLIPGTTYFFAIKTRDEVPNWSDLSNSPSAAAKTDTAAPAFAGLQSAVDAQSGGAIHLSWAAATDESAPITYRIWWSTGAINYGAAPNATTQSLSYQSIGLTNGTAYNFAVRAADANSNVETNTVVKVATPTASVTPSPVTRTYYLRKDNGSNLYGTTSTNSTACSTLQSAAASTGYPVPSRGLLGSAHSCGTASTNNHVTPSAAYTGYRNLVAFYSAPYAVATTVTGAAAGNSFGLRGSGGTEDVRVYFAAVTSAGVHTLSTSYGERLNVPNAMTHWQPDLSAVSISVPAGGRLAVIFQFSDSNSLSANDQIAVDNYNTTILNEVVLTEDPRPNSAPTAPAISAPAVGSTRSGEVNIAWSAATDADTDPIHYDVYGSVNGGTSYPYIVATGVTGTSATWDTVADGIGVGAAVSTVRIRVEAGDGFTHTPGAMGGNFTIDNSNDTTAPATAVLSASTTTRLGVVRLSWTAPGDDNNLGRASQYDIRYSLSAITNDVQFAAAAAVSGVSAPQTAGSSESFEVTGLVAGTAYYFAIKTADEKPNWSAISNSPSAQAGANCSVCHASPPATVATTGSHAKHGALQADCAKCHGTAATTYGTGHSDGILQLGFKTATPAAPITSTDTRITYQQSGLTIYDDTNGGGGVDDFGPAGDNVDNGTCFNFGGTGATGCHGGGTPVWGNPASVTCGSCHGDTTRTADSFGRAFLDSSDRPRGAPAKDLSGASTGNKVGAHLKHLNISYRLTGDSCQLCHRNYLHANGTVNVLLDTAAAGASAIWNAGSPGTCSGTSATNCHGASSPTWSSSTTINCNACHGFGGVNPSHATDSRNAGATCSHCHPQGHPQGTQSGMVMVANSANVGINYASGGIHLSQTIQAVTRTTEAEICWACHDAQTVPVSEWGTNTDANTGSMAYNYGSLNSSNWTSATWTSGTALFSYKTGPIASTHSVNPAATAPGIDAVGDIRCSYCHDVHNLNKAAGDTVTGTPYLRGAWKGNPYKEDGAPQTASSYSDLAEHGAVPRGITTQTGMGGYWIDQNSGNPTSGWTLASSAGLCVLCHGSNVDAMNQFGTPATDWIGTNGHSNAVLGGTGLNAANIFTNTDRGTSYTSGDPDVLNAPMAYQPAVAGSYGMGPPDTDGGTTTRGIRQGSAGSDLGGVGVSPQVYSPASERNRRAGYNWGAKVDNATTQVLYHKFSCSKCHNPHASRLPRLMITNCLDTKHNSWDNGRTPNFGGTNTSGKSLSNTTTAQNCHRLAGNDLSDAGDAAGMGTGWNRVTPW